ncbi:MAG TPA: LPS export ABC transporter periplasmic protein LptC [Bacteroidales bacterium]|nr:LPS export ABC transporter periplasmic protein LptC [Bacteroidales bacterium]HPT20897.1 LPS export ABC transporter periplasmic protein LptC [Bacteroidales bacterium]
MRNRLFTSALILISLFYVSCESKVETIKNIDLLSLPSITVKNFQTFFTDSGKLQLVMVSPILEQYSNSDDPYNEFVSGIKVYYFNSQKDSAGSVVAKYAKYSNKKALWELRDSVVVINEKNDKLETELLFWDQDKDLIYTDRFVKITSEDQIIMGTGFESNSHLTDRKIRKVKATIYLKNEK